MAQRDWLDCDSSLLEFVLLQRGGNATQNSGCGCLPVGAIRSGDPFGTGGRRQPDRRHRCDFHFAAIDLESPSGDESMTDLWQGCHVASGVLISKSLIEIHRFLALDS